MLLLLLHLLPIATQHPPRAGSSRAVLSLAQAGRGLALCTFWLTGCASSGASQHIFMGAYFPSWLVFALLWLLLAVGTRVAMVLAGAGASWPWPLALCSAIGFLLALGLWLLTTGALP